MGSENRTAGNKGIWSRARELAEITPPERNRYVDFLRGLSILAVVLGHWIMAAPYFEGGKPHMLHLLDVEPWIRWLTWLFQVMPIFFFVGGYSNLTSWEANLRKGHGYAYWLGGRLQRLLKPTLPLLGMWMILTLIGMVFGIPRGFIQVGSRIALVPTWFLSVYILVILFVPLTHAAWKKYGVLSIIVPILFAGLVDYAFFAADLKLLGWLNYLFVWLSVHQLGYAWRQGLFSSALSTFLLFPLGLCSLLSLVFWGPYPLSLVGVPTEVVSNTLPPKLPLMALGLAQIGLLLSLEGPARRWLNHLTPWTGTVVVNGMIMTIFLWHSTAMMLMIGLGFWLFPGIYEIPPGSGGWWAVRLIWVAVFAGATVPFLLAFSRFERAGASKEKLPVGLGRLYLGCILTCGGLGYLAIKGIGGGTHWLQDGIALILPFLGAASAGFGPLSRR